MDDVSRALLVGGGGRFPYNGHFRLRLVSGETVLDVAGRIGASLPPEEAWPGVVSMFKLLRHAIGIDRVEMSRSVWDLLASVPPERLGPREGRDLSLLVVAADPDGVIISGVGLGGLLGLVGARARPVVPPTHPLLGEPGLPQGPPRALAPRMMAPAYAAWCHGDSPPDNDTEDLFARCGVTR
jgi:hypothetical protein